MASDGSIRIDIIIDGDQITAASAALAALAAAASAAGGKTQGLTTDTEKASNGIKDMAISIGLVAVASKAFDILKSAIGGAISRFDTLVGFPVIMEQMGFSSEQATNSINKLSDGIQGLPTTLDGIVKNTQGIAILTGDLDTATETTLALNNAFLASGSNAANAERGLTQYVQMLSKGQVDMMSWRTLQETMGYALKETATAFDLANPNELYAALKEGDITFDAFNAKLIELNGGVGGFAELAVTSSAGIATSMGNLKNTVIVGVANMIISFDNLSKAVTGKSIAENLDGLKVVVKSAFKVMGTAIESAAPVVIVFASAIQSAIPVVKALTPVIVGLVAAYATFTVITAASAAITVATVALSAASAATGALTLATKAQIASRIVMTTTDRAGTVVVVANTSAVTLSALAIGVLTGKITLATAAIVIKTSATAAWGAALKFMMGPIGWVTAGIGLLVAGVIAVVTWFNKSTEEGERLTAVTDSLGESTAALNESLNGTSAAHEKNLSNIQGTAAANTDLVAKIEELVAVQDRSGAQTKELNEYVGQLNGSVDGLGLAFDKETNSLSMSSEQLAARITLMKEEETLSAAKERALEISKEQHEVDAKMAETNALREELNQRVEEGGKAAREAKDEIEKLDEQEASLTKTSKDLATQQDETAKQVTASVAAVAEATKNSVDDQLRSYASLEDGQKDIVTSLKETWLDYTEQATDMFDKLSDKSKVSITEMTTNLEENQRIMGEWATNIAKLAERGIDEGLLNTLREAGPESAGHVKNLVNSSDAELQKLSGLFAKGGDVAKQTLSKSLGVENAIVMESVGHLVTQAGDSFSTQVKKADFASLGKAMPDGAAKGVTDGTKGVVDATKKMATETEKAFKGAMDINSPSGVFKKDGVHITEGVSLGIDTGTPKVVATMNKLVKSMLLPFANISAEFQKVGGFAADGLNVGLNNGSAKVMATARGLANNVAATMRNALDTHSPSKVTTEIGKDTGDGLAIGIESTKETNKKAVNTVGGAIKEATKKNVAEVSKIAAEAEKKRTEIQNDYAKKRIELARKSDQSAQSALKTSKNKKGKIVTTGTQRVHNIRADASVKLIKLNEDEQKKLATINTKAWADMQKKENELSKARLEALKNFVADKKSTEGLSAIAESDAWRKSLVLFQEGTKEKIEVQKNYQAALKSVNDEMLSINKDYQGQMKQVDDDYVKEAEKINKDYDAVFEKRFSSFMSIAGTFDAFKAELTRTGSELMENLQSQVDGIKSWQAEFEKVSQSGIDADLLKELSDLGVKALPELVALNSMTSEQMTKYSELYREKAQLAREQTTKELEGTRKDADNKLLELRQTADAQLSKLQTEWMLKIKNLTSTTASELSSLRQIGIDAGQGLLDGLGSMEGPLINKAQEIADGIKNAIQSALDINSPSRWMRDFIAGNMAKGFDAGVDKNKAYLMKSADRLSTFMKPEPIVNLPGSRAMSGVNNNTSNRYEIDKSRTSHTQVTVNSEGEKQDLERMFRRMAFESGL